MLDYLLQDLYRHPVIVGAGLAFVVCYFVDRYWAWKDRDEAGVERQQIVLLLERLLEVLE